MVSSSKCGVMLPHVHLQMSKEIYIFPGHKRNEYAYRTSQSAVDHHLAGAGHEGSLHHAIDRLSDVENGQVLQLVCGTIKVTLLGLQFGAGGVFFDLVRYLFEI